MRIVEPPVSPAAVPFWNATRNRELVLPWCPACERAMWYPRDVCPACLESTIEWRPASGTGVVYASAVHHLPGPGRQPSDLPYVVALIDLPEGVRMMSNVVNGPPDDVHVGMAVTLTWRPLDDGRNVPLFEPARETTAEPTGGEAERGVDP
jgi:uncharacterized protein